MKIHMVCVYVLICTSIIIMPSTNPVIRNPLKRIDPATRIVLRLSALADSVKYYQAIQQPIPPQVIKALDPIARAQAERYNRNFDVYGK